MPKLHLKNKRKQSNRQRGRRSQTVLILDLPDKAGTLATSSVASVPTGMNKLLLTHSKQEPTVTAEGSNVRPSTVCWPFPTHKIENAVTTCLAMSPAAAGDWMFDETDEESDEEDEDLPPTQNSQVPARKENQCM